MDAARTTISKIQSLVVTGLAAMLVSAMPRDAMPQQSDRAAQSELSQTPAGNTLVPFPVVFQQPETGTGFGAAATYLFRPPIAAQGNEPAQSATSAISAFAAYTTHKQILAEVGAELYLDQNRLRMNGGFEYTEFPTTFWGIGNETRAAAEEPYTPKVLGIEFNVQRRFASGWYWSVGIEASHRRLAQIDPGGLLEHQSVPGATDGRFVGLGLGVVHDTRDNTVYPSSGVLHRLGVFRFDGLFGSEFEYTSMTLDLRGYRSLLPSQVFAFRLLGRAQLGDPPFDALPQLGGEELLRGYYGGRFRDRNLVAVQTEYRVPLVWRLGVVGFAEAGQVAGAFDEFSLERTKVSAGGGLRFLLSPKERLALRFDYGWGFDTGSSGFYISLGEAF